MKEGILLSAAKDIFTQLVRLSLKGLTAIVILIIGWLLSNLLKLIVVRLLKALRLDLLSDKLELDKILEKGGISLSLSELLGEISYWFGFLITFVVAVNAVGLNVAADLLNRIIIYIPNIVAAIFILIVGILGASFLGNMAKAGAANAGIVQANFLGNLVKGVVLVFIAILALEQLKISTQILELVIMIILATIGLALAIAFGLGCKDIAQEFMRKFTERLKK